MRRQQGNIIRISNRWYVRYWKRLLRGGVLERHRASTCLGRADGRATKIPPSDILEAARRVMDTVNSSVPAEEEISFVEFFQSQYLPWIERQKKPSTAKGYRQCWRCWIKPVITHDKPLRSIRPTDVGGWMRLIEEGTVCKKFNPDGKRTLSRKSLLRTKSVLSGCFSRAIEIGFLDEGKNPVRGVHISPNARPSRKTYAYTAEEAVAIMNSLPEPSSTIFAVAALAGLRRGEIAGLQWGDLKDGKLHVLRSIWAGRIGSTKTDIEAAVPVIAQLAQRLEFHRMREQARWGTLKPESPMFTNNAGGRIDMNNVINRDILPILTACKHCGNPRGSWHFLHHGHDYECRTDLPKWHGLHAARRSLGSVLHRLGVADKDIQTILRHTSIQTTQSYYVLISDADSKKAMKKYERSLKSLERSSDTNGTLTQPPVAVSTRVN